MLVRVPNTKIFMSIGLIMPLLGTYPKKKIKELNIDLCAEVCIAMLFVILNEKKVCQVAEKNLGIS